MPVYNGAPMPYQVNLTKQVEGLGAVTLRYEAAEDGGYLKLYDAAGCLKGALLIPFASEDTGGLQTARSVASLAEAVARLQAHLEDTDNPHNVRLQDLNIESVGEISSIAAEPVAFETLTALTEIASGVKLADAIAALAVLIRSFAAHAESSAAHVSDAERSSWNSKAAGVHSHDAADLTSGILPLSRGGTGAATASAAREALLADAPHMTGCATLTATDGTLWQVNRWQLPSGRVWCECLTAAEKTGGMSANHYLYQAVLGSVAYPVEFDTEYLPPQLSVSVTHIPGSGGSQGTVWPALYGSGDGSTSPTLAACAAEKHSATDNRYTFTIRVSGYLKEESS